MFIFKMAKSGNNGPKDIYTLIFAPVNSLLYIAKETLPI